MRSIFRGIGWRIFLSFSTLLIVLVLVLSFLSLKFAQKTATDSAANEVRVLSVTLSEQIEKYLKRVETDLKILGAGGGTLDREMRKDRPGLKHMRDTLLFRRNNSATFKDLAIFDLSGNCIVSTDPAWVGLSAQREPFFINGLKRFGYVEIFENRSFEKSLLVTIPINEGMDPQGVLVAQLKLSVLYDLIGKKIGVGGTTEALLLDSKLRLISSEVGEDEASLEKSVAQSPLIQHLQDEFFVEMYKNHHGVQVLGTVTKVPGRQWYLILEKEYSQVEKQVNVVRRALFTATIVLLLALIFITIVLTNSITRPLQILVEEAQKIAAGDFSQPIHVPSGLDEITFLSREFEMMRARISASQGKLIEQLEESEERRIENDRLAAIGTLASSLAHEIRNPLNALSLLLSQLERTVQMDDTKARVPRSMRTEIARLDRLVSDILDYAKPLKLELEAVNLKNFFEDLLDFYKPVLDQKNISIASNSLVDSNLDLNLKVDLNKFKQAFVNLIQNAIEAMPKGGELKVSWRTEKNRVEISVQDSGTGIAEDIQRRLFDLFFTTKETGTGLGLSTVRKIITAHGGTISIEKAKPKGTIVRILFPSRA